MKKLLILSIFYNNNKQLLLKSKTLFLSKSQITVLLNTIIHYNNLSGKRVVAVLIYRGKSGLQGKMVTGNPCRRQL